MNSVCIIGNLTRDPEVVTFNNGDKLCKTSVAVNRRYKNSSGDIVDDTTFVDVETRGGVVDAMEKYLQKGSKVGVTGILAMNKWKTDSGEARSKLLIKSHNIEFLPSSNSDGDGGGSARKPRESNNNQSSDNAGSSSDDGDFDW